MAGQVFGADHATHNTCPSSHNAGPVAEAQWPLRVNCFICTEDEKVTRVVSKLAKSRNEQQVLEVSEVLPSTPSTTIAAAKCRSIQKRKASTLAGDTQYEATKCSGSTRSHARKVLAHLR